MVKGFGRGEGSEVFVCVCVRHPKPETRNPKPETRNPQAGERALGSFGAALLLGTLVAVTCKLLACLMQVLHPHPKLENPCRPSASKHPPHPTPNSKNPRTPKTQVLNRSANGYTLQRRSMNCKRKSSTGLPTCLTQQKVFGELMGNSVAVRSTVGINSKVVRFRV